MAIDDDGREDWPSRVRGAWRELRGQTGINSSAGGALPVTNRAAAHPHALLIESLIGGLPGPAIVLDRDGGVIAFNAAASAIVPSLRRGEPALIASTSSGMRKAIKA